MSGLKVFFFFSISVEQSFSSRWVATGVCAARLWKTEPPSVTVADAGWIEISPWQPCGLNDRWGRPLNLLGSNAKDDLRCSLMMQHDSLLCLFL